MLNHSRKKPCEKSTPQLARNILDTALPDAEPRKAKNQAKAKDPAAVALGPGVAVKAAEPVRQKMTEKSVLAPSPLQ